MENFFKRKASTSSVPVGLDSSSKKTYNPPVEINLDDLPWDPSERKAISSYHPNQKEEIRRKYWIRGPCQPRGHDFPQKMVSGRARRFRPSWFDQYGNWLEYSVKTDKAFCLCCYLFREQGGSGSGSQKEAFVTEGFNNWNKTDRFTLHIGDANSFHNRALKKCDVLMRQDQSIQVALQKQSDMQKHDYRIRLYASIDSCRWLLQKGLPFRGHDESEDSIDKGNFLDLFEYTAKQNEAVRKVVGRNAPGNNQMTAPSIQKDICDCFAQEVLKQILEEIGDDVFALLVDESSDVSKKEQMGVVLRFVDKYGAIKERFVGLVHVMDTSALSLKSAIDSLFAQYGLSMTNVRGQGYDGASNMSGEYNGLKALILKESPSAYYVHCFAHQLQLVVVAVAENHSDVWKFFEMISTVMNVVCASCKRTDRIRENQRVRLEEAISSGTVETGSGLNQERSLQRPGDTRWSSHHKTLVRLVEMYPSVVEVLAYIEVTGKDVASRKQAYGLQVYFNSYDFVFYLHLMLHILGVTNVLSQALQKKDQDILNAVAMVNSTKQQLENFRLDGFDSVLEKVSCFCEKYDIEMVNMEDDYVNPKNRRQKTNFSYKHYYEVDCFNTIMDMEIQEFGNRFDVSSSELLICMGAFNPYDSFCDFDLSKLVRLAEMYPKDFNYEEKVNLAHQLEYYIENVKEDTRFSNLNGVSDLARLMVATRKHLSYPLVYRLLKLTLVLPVATATVERCFSAMKLIKSELRNSMGDEFLNACCICDIEKRFLLNVSNEDVATRFQKMKNRRQQL